MTERERLLKSVADAIADYRAGDLTAPTPGHVDKWVRQFDGPVHLPLLRELLHVLERSYFTRQAVIAFLSRLINNQKLAGGDPCAFGLDPTF